jgi:hypothetical protein
MACVCSRRGSKFTKSDFGAPKKRERAAGDLERTKLRLANFARGSAAASRLSERATREEPDQVANLSIPSPSAMSARGANPSEQAAVPE